LFTDDISFIIHGVTIPVGQKFTYIRLTAFFKTAWKIPENVMALEASDRLIDIIGGAPVDVFQGLPSNSVALLLDIYGKSKEISQDPR
jgi:hypothetical protein